ncbi:MORN repeat-containing protein 3 [Eumeta japonica]|uniref:MORN repeat-containing protein 3 n=1 Tax=Eumeta variegata TaxID=151549 RepID=A0A4C1TLF9_EUMVA|nr:MORN repeat-containing protein 3 [Eumeta japonica]
MKGSDDIYRQGFGILSKKQKNGTFWLKYRGEWQKGKPYGIGWWYYENGDIYFGFWQEGYRHGYGKMWYQDGTLYVGYWKRNSKEGIGMLVQVNGNRYEGNWANDLKNGLGRFYHLGTGQLQEGCWVDDVCIKSKMIDVIREFVRFPTEYPIRPGEEGHGNLPPLGWVYCNQNKASPD